MLRLVAMTVLLSGAIPPAMAADLEADMTDLVAGLPSETAECDFLRALCRAASASADRAEGTPPAADFLATRQGLLADTRLRELEAAAEAIERKRGKRPACFDDEVCRGMLPRPGGRAR